MRRRDHCALVGKRAAALSPRRAAKAWALLAQKLDDLGMKDIPKYADIMQAIRQSTIEVARDMSDEAVRMATRVRIIQDKLLEFWCPACERPHTVNINQPGSWTFNNDLLNPTLSPSILVTGKRWVGKDGDDPLDQKFWPELHCHSFVRDGNIEFCVDSRHDYRGQSMKLPYFPGS